MTAARGRDNPSPQTALAAIQKLTYVVPEHDQRDFERVWDAHGSVIESHLSTKPSDIGDWLDALERYLLSGPAYGKYAKHIYHATSEELRRLECAYDVWHLLEQAGRSVYARGEHKGTRPWSTHERPITESSRWFVKARLAVSLTGTGGKIELFQLAAQEARQGKTKHCVNRGNHMEAYALHYTAFELLRTAIDEHAFEEAAGLFEQARELAGRSEEEGDSDHAYFEEFFRGLCALQDAETRLDFPGARRALKEALQAIRNLPSPEGPFRTPNPWTSLRDLENEERFISVLGRLRSNGVRAVDAAIAALDDIIADCGVSDRKEELTTRLLVLEGLKAAEAGQRAMLERHCAQAAKSTERLRARTRSKRLAELLRKCLSGSQAADVLSSAIPYLPLGLVGIEDSSSPTPLLYSAPSWLRELSKTESLDEVRALLLWYVRLVLDYLWSVCERAAREKSRELGKRPAFADLPYQSLPEQLDIIGRLLQWKGAPAGEIETLRANLPDLIVQLAAPRTDFVVGVEVLIRGTQRWLFPLATFLEVSEGGELLLRRVDTPSQEHRYPVGTFDAGAFDAFTPGTGTTVAYVKPRLGSMTGRPVERNHRPLVLYPAVAYPRFSRTCLIVEGSSDKAFFETMLDRAEPGWRVFRSEADPMRGAIEIRVAHGANKVPTEYYRAHTLEKGAFYAHDTLLESGAERIVVVVDGDKQQVLLSEDADVSRCNHRCALHPDLERIAPTAFQAAVETALRRPLDSEELTELHKHFDWTGSDFAEWVEEKWSIQLKRRDRDLAKDFAVLLARAFPNREDRAKWNAVWDVCDRVLELAKAPRRLRPLVIGLPSKARGVSIQRRGTV